MYSYTLFLKQLLWLPIQQKIKYSMVVAPILCFSAALTSLEFSSSRSPSHSPYLPAFKTSLKTDLPLQTAF